MRLAAYAGASIALAAGAVLRAFHERPNFYSASVYLAQSSACRMILVNFLLLSAGTLLFCLQRLLYGPLRAIEIEQLWERGWYTITETALAMTTFRDDVGVWFFVMFVCLLAGKVWGWLSEGRVEMLEQQPPTNPKLFHTRLIASLLLSQVFDIVMLRYCVLTLLEQPRPGMMVMFAFEYAVLAITSSSTCARYGLSLNEMFVVKAQTKAKLEERREELRAAREEAQSDPSSDGEITRANPAPEDIDENDIDVPGWQEKGRWLLFLDLLTDFLKLTVYVSFFSILIMFHGLPLHIIRDLYLTTRSFYKRINDYLKYRSATRDMHSRYPDATAEDLERDGTCIICREDMRPWQEPQHARAPAATVRRRPQIPTDERQRPKKLPCGHILHFGCLRSWLERQQVCPTCRRSVLSTDGSRNNRGTNQARADEAGNAVVLRPREARQDQQPLNNQHQPRQLDNEQDQHQHRNRGQDNQQAARQGQQHRQGQNDWRARTFNFGPLRVTFAAGNPRQFHDAIRHMQDQNGNQRNRPEQNSSGGAREDVSLTEQINGIERRVMDEINQLNAAQEQLGGVRALQAELDRLRHVQPTPSQTHGPSQPTGPLPQPRWSAFGTIPGSMQGTPHAPTLTGHFYPHPGVQPQQYGTAYGTPHSQQHLFSRYPQATALGPGDPALPNGMAIPEGWSLLPLQRHASPHEESGSQDVVRSRDDMEVLGQVQPNVGSSQENHSLGHTSGDGNVQRHDYPAQNSTNSTNLATANTSNDVSHSDQASSPHDESQASTTGMNDKVRPPTADVPDWSSPPPPTRANEESSNKLEARQAASIETTQEETSTAAVPEGVVENGHVSKDKGKGKAVMVEDAVDEEDGL